MNKDAWIRFGAILATIAALFTILDYLVFQWGVIPALWVYLRIPLEYILQHLFESLILAWLIFLTWLAGGGRTIISEDDFISISEPRSQNSCVDHLSKKDLETILETTKKDVQTSEDRIVKNAKDQVSSAIKPLTSKISDMEYSILELEIDRHASKGQIGALDGLIKKLKLDVKKSWGIEDTLIEIKDYISKKSMPGIYFSDLTNAFKELPDEYSYLKSEITRLAQDKLYDPYK